ncbi:hypothetical protein E5288_WYG007601 [Bos mutus]|uniref:Uncharacterized protein n=1 Tax=Bos mutus TaxID=72004 RepID=A0A6B0RI21_9CETA|nr:hypothetical protein [Bos mutus]
MTMDELLIYKDVGFLSRKVFHCILEWKYRKQRWNEEEEEDAGLDLCGSQKRTEVNMFPGRCVDLLSSLYVLEFHRHGSKILQLQREKEWHICVVYTSYVPLSLVILRNWKKNVQFHVRQVEALIQNNHRWAYKISVSSM